MFTMTKIRKKLKSRKYQILILVIIIGSIFAVKTISKNKASEIIYHKNIVDYGNIEITVLSTGTIQPKNRLEIKPPIPGRVEKVLIEEGDVVPKGKILAWMSSTERAALLDAARAEGEGELARWERLYRPTPILAPIAGTIVLKNVEEGQSFTSADAILVMSDYLTVKAQVDETDIASIKLKLKAEIILDAYPEEKIPAIVDQIAFEAKTVNNVTTYIVDILPEYTPDFMRSGMTANVTFFIERKDNILVVPTESIKNGTVLVEKDKERVKRKVKVGISDGKKTEIISGLSKGDVVLSAQVKLPERGKKSSSPLNPSMGPRPR